MCYIFTSGGIVVEKYLDFSWEWIYKIENLFYYLKTKKLLYKKNVRLRASWFLLLLLLF